MKLDDLELDLNTSHELIDTLRFYGDPTTYLAIILVPDHPTGDIMNDFGPTQLGRKPGVKAREMLYKLNDLEAFGLKEKKMAANLPQAREVKAEIPEQLDMLVSAVGVLEDRLESLEINIATVLSEGSDKVEDGESEVQCTSSIASQIQALRQRVTRVNARTQETISRVEL